MFRKLTVVNGGTCIVSYDTPDGANDSSEHTSEAAKSTVGSIDLDQCFFWS